MTQSNSAAYLTSGQGAKDIDERYDNLLRMLRQAKSGGQQSTTSLISNKSNFMMR
jgi:hypothetical protein